jgi:hypothetical protein
MQLFTYNVTDLTSYASPSGEVFLEPYEVAPFVATVTQDLLTAMPDLNMKGMCLAIYDAQGEPVLFAPLDTIQ